MFRQKRNQVICIKTPWGSICYIHLIFLLYKSMWLLLLREDLLNIPMKTHTYITRASPSDVVVRNVEECISFRQG